MARYSVNEKSYIDSRIVEAGEEIEYSPPEGTTVSDNLTLIEEAKPKKGSAQAE